MRVIATVGMPGSGKSEAAEVAREMDIPVVTMGDVIRREVKKRDLEPSDDNMGEIATELRDEEGMDAVAARCIDMISEKDSDVVFVDGVRGWSEAERFRQEFGDDFTLVAIEVPFETRLNRIRERGRSDDLSTEKELRRRDERELGYGMGEAIEKADETVENTGSLDEFRRKMKSLLKDLKQKSQ
ncbi:MAG: AAA family ATPase [Halobacteria archaeon]|nr:AAA family ATPase [Halobacteria archaeon]